MSIRSTSISRLPDGSPFTNNNCKTNPKGLPLAATVDDAQVESDLAEYKYQIRLVIRKLTPTSEPRASIESGPYFIHYLIENNICYTVIADKSLRRKVVFGYMQDLASEFYSQYAQEMENPRLRPYAFVQFDSYMHAKKKEFQDSGNASGLDKLNAELQDVTKVMTKNIKDLLERGDSLDRMSTLSSSLRDESAKYRRRARNINIEALLRQWAPVGAVALFLLIFIYIKFFW